MVVYVDCHFAFPVLSTSSLITVMTFEVLDMEPVSNRKDLSFMCTKDPEVLDVSCAHTMEQPSFNYATSITNSSVILLEQLFDCQLLLMQFATLLSSLHVSLYLMYKPVQPFLLSKADCFLVLWRHCRKDQLVCTGISLHHMYAFQ